jgi:hypothetical protein
MANGDPPATPGGIGSITAILVLVGGGVATVLGAVTDFGAESGALDAARRNHPTLLAAAAALAAAGLVLGAAYTVATGSHSTGRTVSVGRKLLFPAVLSLGIGIVLGVLATVNREPGRPVINITRTSKDGVKVSVTIDGLSSSDSYEAQIDGYEQQPDQSNSPGNPPQTFVEQLLVSRFSPGQDGKLHWEQIIDISPPDANQTMNYLLVRLADSKLQRLQDNCADKATSSKKRVPTCLYSRIPPWDPPGQ